MLRWVTMAAITIGLCQGAVANPVILGSVSFDKRDGLYTYSYEIENNSNATIMIEAFGVLVDTAKSPKPPGLFTPVPTDSTSPPNWTIETAYGNAGTYFEWSGHNPDLQSIGPNSNLSGFSYSWVSPPVVYSIDDYILAGSAGVFFGNTVSSDFGPVFTPIPSTLPLFATGIALVLARRKKRAITQL